MQQDQPAECIAVGLLGYDSGLGVLDLGTDRVTEGRQSLRRPDRAQLDLRPHRGGIHGIHGIVEFSRFAGGHNN